MSKERNGWAEHEKLVLYRLDSLAEDVQGLTVEVTKLTKKVASMGTRDKFIIGSVSAIGAIVLELLIRGVIQGL